MSIEAIFTRRRSVAEEIEQLIQAAGTSVDAALYRLNNPRLARILVEAAARGLRVRLVLDHGKYDETEITRELMSKADVTFRLLPGRLGRGSKMHHKFAILDDGTLLTGSYNWTVESEKENFDNLLVIRGSDEIKSYRQEFEALWKDAEEIHKPEIKK
jgi:mitochondrial cardiolipin hydrolase